MENEAKNEIDEYQTKIKKIHKEIDEIQKEYFSDKKKVQKNINKFNLVEKNINLINKNKDRNKSINFQNLIIAYTKNTKSYNIKKRYTL